ncbi:MAG: hypothetical protein LQ349_006286 [Xanthoria aureola]|nr:MAG: hypothetical protein LQ349_006286 [Xanthoria aureola]
MDARGQKLDGRPGPEPDPLPRRKGIMNGANLEIGLASATLLIPMLALSAILITLVFSHQMPNNNSTYTITGDGTAESLGAAYYVDYSATTLVYIASLSSTVATLLLSAAMVLLSYFLASKFAKQSDNGEHHQLPSPYQLELLIRIIDGRLMALWSYLLYLFGSKQKRIRVMPVLLQASALMIALVILVGLINLADLWLHLGTKSVQYLAMRPSSPYGFTPGRGLSPSCLSDPRGDTPTPDGGIDVSNPADCIIFRGDAANQPTLANHSEFIRTAGNQSDVNQVFFDNGLAVLGPYNPRPDWDFEATSFGSRTSCRVVTSECGAKSNTGAQVFYHWVSNYKCNDTAGLNLTGNFLALMPDESGMPPELTGAQNGDPEWQTQTGNSLQLSQYDMGFQYFQDSAKQQQIKIAYSGFRPDTPQLNWAVVFKLHLHVAFWIEKNNPSGFPIKNVTGELDPWASLNLAYNMEGGANGILSCQTNISEVLYQFVNGTFHVKDIRPPRENASIPFVSGIFGDWAYEQLHQGLQLAVVGATNPDDLAASFASAYDQAVLSVPAGVMQPLPAINVTRRVVTQVARVPVAPFFTLILLNLLFVFIGVILTVMAASALSTGQSVKDAQARLSVAAVVAESFENPALGDDARNTDELYAERRGKVTRRVALGKTENGGRRFKQIVIKSGEESGELLR